MYQIHSSICLPPLWTKTPTLKALMLDDNPAIIHKDAAISWTPLTKQVYSTCQKVCPARTRKIAESMGSSSSNIQYYLHALANAGLIVKNKDRITVWSLPETKNV